MKKIIWTIVISLSFIACGNNPKTEQSVPQVNMSNMGNEDEHKYTPEMVVNKIDFSCGMPTSAGISDTVHYQGNAYGFCSPECKAAFLLDPSTYIASK